MSRMLVRERHRGPDDEGVSALHGPDGRVLGAIGSVRLAVLDPTPDGHQPMHDPATGDVLVFNGELFNHREVRRALGDAVPWRSGTDTETLLRAYQRWGPGCLERLRGMFGFALWDARAQALWCARDRLGIKPLYYTEAPAGLAFASEVRALVASGLVGGGLDPDGLRSYVRYGAVSEPATLLQGVRSLEAGDWVRVDGGRIVERRAYWRPAPRLGRPPRRAAAQAAVDEALTRAVEEHLLADVPVATLLSGGVDSSLVTALAARLSPG
ncbi:MAG: asparagine synthetase B, partial [Planctomycetota bacterium]|nr:asparagine synthetase B [Planctomycetota bacterium]